MALEEWGPTTVGAVMTAVIAALGTWGLKVYSKKLDTMVTLKKLEVGAEKGANSRVVTELRASNAKLIEDFGELRGENHTNANLAQTATNKAAVLEERWKQCEEDRKELWEYVQKMVIAMRSNGIAVPERTSP